jgi:predicted patatin/cPLA2 family phospholipase
VWRGGGRRRLLERLVAQGDSRRLFSDDTHLILLAVALDSGRLAHFTNWSAPSARFKAHIERYMGEVVSLDRPEDVILAAVASSAIPVVFEPVTIRGRSFVDAGGFTNQPIHAVMADGADAVIVVLVSPRHGPRPPERELHIVDIMGRVLELADWRDLQSELLGLPAEWRESGNPSRLVVIQPDAALSGGLLGFDPANAAELMRLGAEDAWQALEGAGWLAKAETPVPAPAPRV